MVGGRSKPVSIRDVANAAAVSIATASRVLSRVDYPVAEKTRLRVEQAATDLGFGEQRACGRPMVVTDNRDAGRQAARYLWELGHRRFAYLTAKDDWHDFHERGAGLEDFLNEQQAVHELTIVRDLLNEKDTYAAVSSMAVAGMPATAILASTDRHAVAAIAALVDAGIDVPSRISVVGFDDYVSSSYVRPALTTMQMPAQQMGAIAVELLDRLIAGKNVEERTTLRAALIIRGSAARFS